MKYSELTNVAILSALKAGDILSSGFGTVFKIDSKEGIHNLVTEYDKKAEKAIIDFIKSNFFFSTLFFLRKPGPLGQDPLLILDKFWGKNKFFRHLQFRHDHKS